MGTNPDNSLTRARAIGAEAKGTRRETAAARASVRSGGRSGYIKLRYCRVLLSDLDPQRPPLAAQAREFSWQYRALSERVDVLSDRLAVSGRDRSEPLDESLRKAEAAVDLSLQYFQDVLKDDDRDA